jgi:hypothetical protein
VNDSLSNSLKMAGIGIAMLAAVGFAISRGSVFWKTGEDQAKAWFYDLSEKKLYAAPINCIPPHAGIGGKRGDGARAMVVNFGPSAASKGESRIAYLEMYTPELKNKLEEVQASRAAGKPFAGKLPAADSDFFQSNTLVKRVDDVTWQPLNTPEGAQITSEWRAWRGKQGETPMVSVP